MCEVPISNMLNDIRNLAVRRVAAGLEPHISGAACIRDENMESWEFSWLTLSNVRVNVSLLIFVFNSGIYFSVEDSGLVRVAQS